MTPDAVDKTSVRLRAFRPEHLPDLVTFWNGAFSGRRGFTPITESSFRRRILRCPAFDPPGLILAWQRTGDGRESIAGLVHAFRPPPNTPAYARWGRHHSVGVLYVAPSMRCRGIGSRLLKAAENWLYYCPIHFAGQSVPCYGGVEGPQPTFFGSTQRMGVNAKEKGLLHFLARRGYAVVDPGDISMMTDLQRHPPKPPADIDLDERGLRLVRVDHNRPFQGSEPLDRQEYATWGANKQHPYAALILVDSTQMLRGHICWYPLPENGTNRDGAGIYAFWLAPDLRGAGLGSLLLDAALSDMVTPSSLGGPFERAEVQTHLVRHATAVALYESRGFQIDDAWVTLVKT